jgi:hypothetical protein
MFPFWAEEFGMTASNGGFSRGVNQAGKVVVDETVKVRYKEQSRGPLVTALTKLLNAFGNAFCPIKEEKKK